MDVSILSGQKILQEIEAGAIKVSPFEPKNINPASLDLRLGEKFAVYDALTVMDYQQSLARLRGIDYNVLDAKQDNQIYSNKLDSLVTVDYRVLQPGILYLMHTVERISTDKYVPIIEGKSSIGRLGISIHLTAGYGDPGFDGQYTLEVTVVHPVKVYPGMRFCQIRFNTIEGEVTSYKNTGHYIGEAANGPVSSRSYLQFEDE